VSNEVIAEIEAVLRRNYDTIRLDFKKKQPLLKAEEQSTIDTSLLTLN
jgi:hypothetical protein